MSKTVITRICWGQPELAVKLVQPGCNGGQLISWENIRLVIHAPECNRLLKSPQTFTGCWPSHHTPWTDKPPPHELPAIVYPAFGTDPEGQIVFRFDKLLFKLPPGRYIGDIELNNGMPLAHLDIDLCTTPVLIDSITQTSQGC